MARLTDAVGELRSALREEMRDSIHLEMALRFYAQGGDDGGEIARVAIADVATGDVHISRLLDEAATA